MKGNKQLLDGKRFKWLEKRKVEYLRNLSLKESVRIFESLTSPQILEEFIDNFFPDNPVCLKIALKKRRWQTLPRYSGK